MNIDITSFFFNSTIEGATATCAWGTSIGQSKSKECRIETDVVGVNDFLTGLIYKSKSDIENFDLSKASKNREYLIRSIFDKVFVNGKRVKDKSFIVLLARENTASHSGRLIISYPPYASYKNGDMYVNNDNTIAEMFNVLECKQSGCWFSYDISVINQDELHFSCVVVNKDNSMVYKGKSSERSAEWASLIPDAERRNLVINTPSPFASRQIIYYGAPGTGKSHKIKEILGEYDGCPEDKKVPKANIFRTTFHPDSDYSTFVGAYKPTMKRQYRYEGKVKATYYEDDDLAGSKKGDPVIEKVIEYSFVPQAFLNAYIRAYQTDENVYLIIEEINRGNCAQIFGDLFQLLDRDRNGKSEYTIKADADLKAFLKEKLGGNNPGIKDGELCLPPNLYIYATMNTSDQSLFPIDSAFKRRWDWEYEPIKYKNTGWNIEIDKQNKYSWVAFQEKVNKKIFDATHSEDKMLGDYFVNPTDLVITADVLRNKILFYLWNDVCKDGDADIFPADENFSFSKLYDEDSKQLIISIMDKLELKPINGDNTEDEDDMFEGEDNNSSSIRYSINGGESFQKTNLASELFKEYIKLYPDLSVEELISNWKNLEGKKPKHLIEDEIGYSTFIQKSKGDRNKNERRFEQFDYKGHKVYLWKGWGDGPQGNILPFMELVNKSNWGITIKRV